MRYFIVTFIFPCITGIATAGLDQAGKYNEVIAIYKFDDVLDSGPRETHGALFEESSIAKINLKNLLLPKSRGVMS